MTVMIVSCIIVLCVWALGISYFHKMTSEERARIKLHREVDEFFTKRNMLAIYVGDIAVPDLSYKEFSPQDKMLLASMSIRHDIRSIQKSRDITQGFHVGSYYVTTYDPKLETLLKLKGIGYTVRTLQYIRKAEQYTYTSKDTMWTKGSGAGKSRGRGIHQ